MSEVPPRCTACRTPMVAGELRCRQCGKVYGADNYCATCHNTAAVRAVASGYRCLACGAPRERKPGTIVLPDDPLTKGAITVARRGTPGVLRALGVLSIGGGLVTAATLFALVGGAAGVALGAAFAAAGAGFGALFLWSGARTASASAARDRAERELALVELAEKKGGTLTVTGVATALGLASAEAEAALNAMVDGSRVVSEITPDGRIEYVFRELAATRGPRVRVELPEEAAQPVEVEAPATGRREEPR